MTEETQLFPVKKGAALATTAEAAVARAAQEVQAAMVIAKKFPRNETESFNRIITACKRKSLAECATYSYPRGGTAVTGPSIRLAECLAQNWGNMDFGVVELDQRNGESQVMAYAWDLETNCRQTKIFTVKHERRVGKGEHFHIDQLSDPRDIYEMVANNGARRLRSCILGVIPGDVVDAAVDQCDKTIEEKDPKMPLADKFRAIVGLFEKRSVTLAMLERKLGHKLDEGTSREYNALLKIWNALKDNMAKVDDFFPPETTKPDFGKAPEPEDDVPFADEPAAEANQGEKGGAENSPASAVGGLKVLDGQGQEVGNVPTDGEAELGPDQAWLASGMGAAGVPFDDFLSWLKTTGYSRPLGYRSDIDIDSLPDWGAVPGVIIAALKKDTKAVAAIIKLYGKKA